MSDIGETTDQVTETAPVGEGEVATENPTTEAPDTEVGHAEVAGEAAQPDALDVTEYGSKLVPIKVNGEVEMVPLSEAINGYQRQADYTRGKQEVAEAAALKAALERNPEQTLSLLQQTYGKQEAARIADEVTDDGFDPNDPVAQRLKAFESRMEAFDSWQMEQQLTRTLDGLKGKYGDDFNEQEVIQAAVSRQIEDPAELESVFRDLVFDKFYAQTQAQREAAQRQAAETAAREAAKTEAGQVVSSGNGVTPKAAGAPPETFDSFEAAFQAAKSAVGFRV